MLGVSLEPLIAIHRMSDYNIAAALTNVKHYYYCYFSSNHLSQSLVFGVSLEPVFSIHIRLLQQQQLRLTGNIVINASVQIT